MPMQFEASLKLWCSNPELVATAICNEDTEVSRSSVTYIYEKDHLLVKVSSGEIKYLGRTLNSIISRFKLSVSTVDACERLMNK